MANHLETDADGSANMPEVLHDFKKVLSQIHHGLKTKDTKAMVFLCLDIIGMNEAEDILGNEREKHNPLKLFDSLQQKSRLSEGNFFILCELLYHIHRTDLLKLIVTDEKVYEQQLRSQLFPASLKPFRIMLLVLHNHLGMDDDKKLKFNCEDKLSRKPLKECNDAADLFQALLDCQEISENNVQFLEFLMKQLERKDLLDVVERYKRNPRHDIYAGQVLPEAVAEFNEMVTHYLPVEEVGKENTYPMDKPGLCLVFNLVKYQKRTDNMPGNSQEDFTTDVRLGSDKDSSDLQVCFGMFGFKVCVVRNPTFELMRQHLLNARRQLLGNEFSCFICCILAHGRENRTIITCDQQHYKISAMAAMFDGEQCPAMAGKPKIFLVQACQGRHTQGLASAQSHHPPVQPDNTEQLSQPHQENSLPMQESHEQSTVESDSISVPSYADFLFSYATVANYTSYRDKKIGSWYIQALVSCLTTHANRYDFLSILTQVNHAVANKRGEIGGRKVCQIPEFQTSFTKQLFLKLRQP